MPGVLSRCRGFSGPTVATRSIARPGPGPRPFGAHIQRLPTEVGRSYWRLHDFPKLARTISPSNGSTSANILSANWEFRSAASPQVNLLAAGAGVARVERSGVR